MFGRLFFLGLYWLPVAIGFAADEVSLVRVGEVWSYRTGTNPPSSPITSWRSPGFDDSTWSQGLSGFTTFFTVDYKEATLWQGAENYHSVFLRRRFNVANTSAIKWLILRLNYDDGFVAYLNGHEIARHGLTNDPVAFDDFADPHPFTFQGGAAEEFDVSASAALLTVGENLLAIEGTVQKPQ